MLVGVQVRVEMTGSCVLRQVCEFSCWPHFFVTSFEVKVKLPRLGDNGQHASSITCVSSSELLERGFTTSMVYYCCARELLNCTWHDHTWSSL